MMKDKFYTVERSQQIVLALLKAHGIRKVVASPGTTNLTLVASMQQDPWFELYSSVDERSAAYMACGMAAESGEAVVLSCTGATASRNYMPGLTEAFYRKLPVLAITANQGRHKIGHLIAQNIDRTVIPNDIAVESVFVQSCQSSVDEKNCEILVNKALLALFANGGGPSHINLSTEYSRDYSAKELPSARVIKKYSPSDVLPPLPQGRVAIFVGSHKKWSNESEEVLDLFCATHDAVVFCDHTSGYHGKYRVCHALVGSQHQYRSELMQVDTLIHIGEVSGDYYATLRPQRVWRVSEDGELKDTFGCLSSVFQMDEVSFFKHYATGGTSCDYLELCQQEYKNAYSKIPELPFGNIWIAKQIHKSYPVGSTVHFGILNTLRSWNFFELPKGVHSDCNVGGFGIDGILSTLIGASLTCPNKIFFAIIGDLAFFYDLNSLGNRHVGRNVRILLINNGKGTEFRNYDHPGSVFEDDADPYIAAADHYGRQSRSLVKHYAEDLGYEYMSASTKEEFLVHKERFLTSEMSERPMLFEVFTNSEDESEALKSIRSILVDNSVKRKVVSCVKSTIKAIAGDAGINVVKRILGK